MNQNWGKIVHNIEQSMNCTLFPIYTISRTLNWELNTMRPVNMNTREVGKSQKRKKAQNMSRTLLEWLTTAP